MTHCNITADLKFIGVVHTPYKELKDCPRNIRYSEVKAQIEVFKEYEAALQGIESCSHIFVFYWLEQADRELLQVTTKYDGVVRGVFANRSPHRPNPIGIGITELISCKDNILEIKGIDCLDSTPLIDIKPYIPENDSIPTARVYEK